MPAAQALVVEAPHTARRFAETPLVEAPHDVPFQRRMMPLLPTANPSVPPDENQTSLSCSVVPEGTGHHTCSSVSPSQSSSALLHDSSGGVQDASQRQAVQLWVPSVPHEVEQLRGGAPSQSSTPAWTKPSER